MEQTNKSDLKKSLLANDNNQADGVYFELAGQDTNDAPKEATYTKYEGAAITILVTAILFLLALIGYIFYTFKNGIVTSYCKDPNFTSFTCGSGKCYNPSLDCVDENKTVAAFFGQLLLIGLLSFKIYTLVQSLRKGVEIYKPQEPKKEQTSTNKFKQLIAKSNELKETFESKKINCRKYAYKKKDTPQETAVMFIKNSIFILTCLDLLKQAPEYLINIITGLASDSDTAIFYVYIGLIMFLSIIC